MNFIRCTCVEGTCVKGVEPPSDCINRLDGVVESTVCSKCNGPTWHHNGECIRCQRLERDQKKAARPVLPRHKQRDKSGPLQQAGLTLTIKCGNEFVVSDKTTVAKILKILLEDK